MDEVHSFEPGVLLALAQTLDDGLTPRKEPDWPGDRLETPFGPIRIRVEGARVLTLHTMNEERGHDPILVHRVPMELNLDARCGPEGAWVVPYSRYGVQRSDRREVSAKARSKLHATLASLIEEWAGTHGSLLHAGELARLGNEARKHEEMARKHVHEALASLRQLLRAQAALDAARAGKPAQEG